MNAFKAHVDQIAKENGIIVLAVLAYEDRWKAFAVPPAKFIQVAEVVDEETYAIAMHELGHCLARQYSTVTIVSERAAWAWAESKMFWKSPAMEAVKARAMGRPDLPDQQRTTYERQHFLEGVRAELQAQAEWMPAPVIGGTETMADFMTRRKRR